MCLGWASLPSHSLLSLAHDSPETITSSLPVTENFMSTETQSTVVSCGGFLTLFTSPLLHPGSLAPWDFSQISYLHSRLCYWEVKTKAKGEFHGSSSIVLNLACVKIILVLLDDRGPGTSLCHGFLTFKMAFIMVPNL